MTRARRIHAALVVAVAVAVLGPVAAVAQDTGTGHKDVGESASPWEIGGLIFWMGLVLVMAAIVVLVLVRSSRGGDAASPAPDDDPVTQDVEGQGAVRRQ
jgi:hypothetical protein